jgi:hypothetical protein
MTAARDDGEYTIGFGMEELSDANLRGVQDTGESGPTFILWNDLPPSAGGRDGGVLAGVGRE